MKISSGTSSKTKSERREGIAKKLRAKRLSLADQVKRQRPRPRMTRQKIKNSNHFVDARDCRQTAPEIGIWAVDLFSSIPLKDGRRTQTSPHPHHRRAPLQLLRPRYVHQCAGRVPTSFLSNPPRFTGNAADQCVAVKGENDEECLQLESLRLHCFAYVTDPQYIFMFLIKPFKLLLFRAY